jgi:hypothetical protein
MKKTKKFKTTKKQIKWQQNETIRVEREKIKKYEQQAQRNW